MTRMERGRVEGLLGKVGGEMVVRGVIVGIVALRCLCEKWRIELVFVASSQ
jgi:hypothetical protein